MLNALTVDVEDWYMTNGLDLPRESWHRYEDRIVGTTMRLLELFRRYEAKGTFFVLGCVAERHPALVEAIAKDGHDIGTHGHWHRMLTRMTEEEIYEDILSSRDLLERISGQRVHMFRAPSWSITPDRYPLLSELEKHGFVCDSSIQPFRTPLSGVGDAPVRPFHPVLDGERLGLVEFPATVLSWRNWRVPFSGGFYLRALPYWFVKQALLRINRTSPGMVYVHPWELDPKQPRGVAAGPLVRLAQYYNLGTTERKLDRLLRDFSFAPLSKILNEYRFADIPLSGREAVLSAGRGVSG